MYELHDTSSATGCTCHECNADKTYNGLPWASCVMIVCADCGNKRCPKATSHKNACTNSNEPGQPGSLYQL
jgi:hypothetical protein